MQEALDTDLDAFLDRALSAQPAPEQKPERAAEKPAERLQSVLALAAEEEQWIPKRSPTVQLPESAQDLDRGECEIPEHLRAKPAPEVSPALAQAEVPWAPSPAPLPGLAVVPQPGWNFPVAPAPVAPRRLPWLVTGALAGVSAASVLVAAMLWMTRDTLPEKAQTSGTSIPAMGNVTTVVPPAATPAPAPEPVLFVKSSPLPREPDPHLAGWIAAAEGSMETRPEPKVEPAPGASAQPPPTVVAKAEPIKPRKARAAQQPARRDVEAPTVADMEEEEEIPFRQQPVAARAPEPVAKPKPPPPAAPKPSEYDELDRKFAEELGFTGEAVRKQPERNGVKSVWIPPAPGEGLPQTLKPGDIQQVVAANQPAITSCLRRHKDAIPGLNGGKFVMRWFIHPSGSTYQIAMETQSLRGTAMATCIEDVVRGWKFPKHQTQMGPIRFPFTF